MAMVKRMAELSLSLLTRQAVKPGSSPLVQIWSLDHWLNSLDRVCGIRRISVNAERQHFILQFDAGRAKPDQVEVERLRLPDRIRVIHRVPPPGVLALSAQWWTEATHPDVLFASRNLLVDEDAYSPAMARSMFALLRENLNKLTGRPL